HRDSDRLLVRGAAELREQTRAFGQVREVDLVGVGERDDAEVVLRVVDHHCRSTGHRTRRADRKEPHARRATFPRQGTETVARESLDPESGPGGPDLEDRSAQIYVTANARSEILGRERDQ